jgi:hypothetical protein
LQGCLVGSRLFIFGGEDAMRRPLGELLVLDLATWQWSRPETSGGWVGRGLAAPASCRVCMWAADVFAALRCIR